MQYHIHEEGPEAPPQHPTSAPQTMTAATLTTTPPALSHKTSIVIPDEESTGDEVGLHEFHLT